MFNKRRILFLLYIILISFMLFNVTFAEDVCDSNKSAKYGQDFTLNDSSILSHTTPDTDKISKNYNNNIKTENNEEKYVYVSNSGNVSNNGEDILSPTTLQNALDLVDDNGIILLEGNEYNLTENISTKNLKTSVKNFKITSRNNVTLNFLSNSTIQLLDKCNIEISNITFAGIYESNSTLIENTANLTLKNCLFKNVNNSNKYGLIYSNNTLTFENCSILNNSASRGGLITCENSSVKFIQCVFEDNIASEGGVLSAKNSMITSVNSSYTRNSALFGGVFLVKDNSNLSVDNSSFVNNSAANYGAVINSWYSTNLFNNSILTGNTANIGGVVFSANNRNTTIINSLLENNSANLASNVYSYNDNLTVDNNVILSQDNESSVYCFNSSYCLDNNWWGMNNPNFSIITNNILPNNWRIMAVDADNHNLIRVHINHLSDSEVLNKNLINRYVYFYDGDTPLNFENKTIISQVENSYEGSPDNIRVKIDNQLIKIGEKLKPYLNIDDIYTKMNSDIEVIIKCNPDIDNVDVKINNIYLDSFKPVKGIITFKYILNSSWNEGTYNISASITNNTRYADTETHASLFIRKKTQPIVNNVISNNEIIEEDVTVNNRLNIDTAKSVQTSIKNQGTSGSCWAFSTLSTLESAYLKAYGIEYDFSENNMKNVMKKYSIIGDNKGIPNTGNKELEPISYLVGWYGPVDEISEPYNEYSTVSALNNNSVKVEDVYFIYRTTFNGKDNKKLKEAIMKYGALSSSIYSSYSISSSRSLYSSVTPYADHAISIVGWDDFYSTTNFYGMTKPQANGAYIIKNSWGDSAGENGYQYVSYYDTSLAGVNINSNYTGFSYAFPVQQYSNYTHIYQHDTVSTVTKSLSPSAWIRNIYTAEYNESIAGIGTFIYEDCDYEAYVYVNDELCYSQEGNFSQAGYRTIKLKEYTSVTQGDIFRIDLKLKSRNHNNISITLQDTTHYKSISKENQSFISSDGLNWNDLYYDNYYTGTAACLKVYTKDIPTINSTVSNNSKNYTVTTTIKNIKSPCRLYYKIDEENYTDYEENPVYIDIEEDGTYNMTIDNKNVKGYEYNLTVNLKTEDITLSETFELYSTLNLNIKAENLTYFVDEEQLITARVEIDNIYHSTLNEGLVTLSDGFSPINECEITNGCAKFIVNKTAGNYNLTLSYNSSHQFNCPSTIIHLNVKKHNADIQISDVKNNTYNHNTTIKGKLMNKEDNTPINSSVKITINEKEHLTTAAVNGEFIFSIKSKYVGINNLTVVFEADEKYNQAILNTEYTVEKADVIVTCNPISEVACGTNVSICGKFLESTGKDLSNSNVHIFVNGVKYIVRTDTTGTYILSVPVSKIGVNNISVGYGGNAKYNAYETNTTFNVGKQDVIVTFNPVEEVAAGTNVTITGKFTDNLGKAITNSNVRVFINGVKYLSRTDKNGNYVLSALVKRAGVNNISVGYGGNAKYNPYELNGTFNVGKQNVIVTYNPVKEVAAGTNVTITGKFTDNLGKAITNSNVRVFVNGVKYLARTDKKGNYNLSVLVTKVGVNNLSVGYGGNAKYNAYEVNSTFNVEKQDVIVTYNKISDVKKGKNVTITGKFTDNLGKAITNSNVKVVINGVKNLVRTNSKGVYTFTQQMNTVGTFNVTVGYGGNAKYNAYETNTTFKVTN